MSKEDVKYLQNGGQMPRNEGGRERGRFERHQEAPFKAPEVQVARRSMRRAPESGKVQRRP